MFSFQLPVGGLREVVRLNQQGKLETKPSVSRQRIDATMMILDDRRWTTKLKKIVDFGCGKMHLVQLLRNIDIVEHIIEVDIDDFTLEAKKHLAKPLNADFIKGREHPLRIEIFRGSITDAVENLRDIDAVIALEVIQELTSEDLKKSICNVFGFVQPKLAIFSTPNRNMNVLLDGINENGLRSSKNVFEWTQVQFRNWTKTICATYPNYSVSHLDIGRAPQAHKKLGPVTQMAIFVRNDLINRPLKEPLSKDWPVDTRPEVQYKEIYTVDYPQREDKRTTFQKVKDEAFYYVNRCQGNERFHNRERSIYQIPIKFIFDYARSLNADESDVLKALDELEFKVENDFIVLTEEYVDENTFHLHGDYEDFLDNQPYHYNEEIDGNSAENTPTYVGCDEPEESWD